MVHTRLRLILVVLLLPSIAFGSSKYIGIDAEGATSQFTLAAGSTKTSAIATDNSVSGYISEGTVNDVQMFTFSAAGLDDRYIIDSVKIFAYMCKVSGTTATMRMDISKDGSTWTNGTAATVPVTVFDGDLGTTVCENLVSNGYATIDGAPWTEADVDGLQIRLTLTANTGSGVGGAYQAYAYIYFREVNNYRNGDEGATGPPRRGWYQSDYVITRRN